MDVAPAGKVEQVGELVLAHDRLPLVVDAARECARRLGPGPLCEHLCGPGGDGREVDGGVLAVRVLRAGDARDRVEGGWRQEAQEVGGAVEVGEGVVEAVGEGRGRGAVELADAGEGEREAVLCASLVLGRELERAVVLLVVLLRLRSALAVLEERDGGLDDAEEGLSRLERVGADVAGGELCSECRRVQGGVCLCAQEDEALDRGGEWRRGPGRAVEG